MDLLKLKLKVVVEPNDMSSSQQTLAVCKTSKLF